MQVNQSHSLVTLRVMLTRLRIKSIGETVRRHQAASTQESFSTSHVYSTAGSYLTYCSATDADGDFLGDGSTQVNVGTTSTIQYTAPSSTTTQNSATQTTSAAQSTTVTVTQSAFSVTATPYPGTGTAPLNVEFATSSTPGSSYTCSWTFGDGSSASGCTVQHTYTAVGTYVAQSTATSATSDQISVSSATVSVTAPTTTASSTIPLSVSIVASPSSGNAPLSTTFTSSVSGGTAPYTYSWSFGDSSTSALADPAHTYQNPGTFLAQLTVTELNGRHRLCVFILWWQVHRPLHQQPRTPQQRRSRRRPAQ